MIAIHQQEFANIQLSVSGIIFLGAPFQGSDIASIGTWLAQISGLDSAILKLLEKQSSSLYALSRDFWGSYSERDLVCYSEKNKAKYGPVKKQVSLYVFLVLFRLADYADGQLAVSQSAWKTDDVLGCRSFGT